MKLKNQKFSFSRSTEGTIFELAFVVLAIVVWALIIVMLNHAPETVATHFDATGTPDDYGSKLNVLLPLILTTAGGGCMLLGAYFPHTVNLPVSISNIRQALLAARMLRVMALVFLLLTLAIAFTCLNEKPSAIPAIVVVVVIIGIVAFFTLLIYKAK